MSRQDANAAFALTSFLYGGNARYIEDLYARYEADPAAVDAEWRSFFQSLKDDARDVAESARGASWGRPDWPLAESGELAQAPGEWAEAGRAISGKVKAQAQTKGVALSAADVERATRDSIRALMLIRAYRARGHFHANLDPLGLTPPHNEEELDPRTYGFTEADLDRPIFLDHVLGLEFGTLREIIAILRRTYCQTLGVEFLHISDGAQKGWIQERIEGPDKEITFTREGKRAILNKLVEAEGFEKFCDVKFTGTKRFGLDGAELMIPALEQIIKRGGALGVREIVIGMSHRGRLNVLAQVMGKPHRAIFHEFKGGSSTPNEVEGSGDVKYHLGASSDREFDSNTVHLSLTANPSHLEIVDPVVLGKVRAKQDQHHCTPEDRTCVMPLLIHGDAAFAGQGVVAECFGLSGLRGHRTGGSLHFIVNNQIGFTTNPRYARSSPYPSDVAKMIEAPIFHVNGDDPEAVVFAAKVATEFRQKFQKPVVIDMFCYRRHGHNEGDEPSFTQPRMYKAIANHPGALEIYANRLIGEGVVTEREVEKMKADWRGRLDAELESAQNYRANKADWLDGRWAGFKSTADGDDPRRGRTGVEIATLQDIGRKITTLPPDFHLHRTLNRFLENRRRSIESGTNIDWATAEALAFCSLLLDGHRVRLSGQDSERGTFSQRHAVLFDQETEKRYTPFNHLAEGQARFEVINSMLSEEAVLGFEYGYSLAEPNALTMWEAQFGDFANGAQVVFDQFISSGERKWLRMSGLVCLLAARLRRAGPRALLGAARALPADVRRGQHAGRQLHDAGELFPHSAPAAQARLPQAARPDDAEIAAAPQACRIAARRDGTGDHVPPAAVGRRADACSRRRAARGGRQGASDQARGRRQHPPRRYLLRQGLFRSLRRAREAWHRRRLPAAHRAALPVPGQGADDGADAVQAGGNRLVPGRAAQHGRMGLRRHLPGMGAQPDRRQAPPRPLHRPPGVRLDGGGADVAACRAAQAVSGRGAALATTEHDQ